MGYRSCADYKEKITDDFITELAEIHIESRKDRYFRKNKRDIAFDLSVNHDPGLEIEAAKQLLGRELTDWEQTKLVQSFNTKVVKIIY